jgi:hypothetical protein
MTVARQDDKAHRQVPAFALTNQSVLNAIVCCSLLVLLVDKNGVATSEL